MIGGGKEADEHNYINYIRGETKKYSSAPYFGRRGPIGPPDYQALIPFTCINRDRTAVLQFQTEVKSLPHQNGINFVKLPIPL